ncbi:MAG: hypothetical protein Q9214_007933, partial [Letrouitia sp. 1 TL-2023]
MTSQVPPTVSNPTVDPAWLDSREPQILGASITLLVLPTVAVLLRLLSRWLSGAGYWLDDYTIILAMIFSWGPNIVNIV